MKLQNGNSGRANGRALIALSTTPLRAPSAFDVAAAKQRLWRCHAEMRGHEFAMYGGMRSFGLIWADICAWLDDPTHHPDHKRQSAEKWARKNAPYNKRWMDEYKKFALEEWDDFLEAWKWAEGTPYAPDRRPSLQAARDLIARKIRMNTYQSAAKTARSAVRPEPVPKGPVPTVAEETNVTPINRVLRGDVVAMLQKYIPDNSIDHVVSDPPWFLRIPDGQTPTDWWYDHYGMGRRYRPDWDKFGSVQEYADVSEVWIREVMRVLRRKGSLFVMGSFHNIGLVNYVLQTMGINMVQQITVVKTNGRPTLRRRGLQSSNFHILWATKRKTGYRFNDADCKRAVYPTDPFNNTRGQMMRDTWFIQNDNGRRTEKDLLVPPKNIEVYNRLLTVTGKPGGTSLETFAGSGTGAIAAMRWGMKSVSVERDSRAAAYIIARIEAEMARR